MEKRYRKRPRPFGEQCLLRFEVDLAVGAVVQLGQQRGGGMIGVNIGFQGIGLRLFDQVFERKGAGLLGIVGSQGSSAQGREEGDH